MKKIAFAILCLCQLLPAAGQDLNINHYPFYRDGLNPGSFIQSPDVNLFLLYNREFMGFAQEPNMQVFDMSVNLNGNKLGLMVLNDMIGFDITQNVKLRYARRFLLSEKTFFSLGLGSGAIHRNLRVTKMSFEEEGDPMSLQDYAHTVLDFDFGAEFHFSQLVLGMSVNHLGKPLTRFEETSPVPHYYAYGQYTFFSRSLLRFKPNVLFRYWRDTYWVEAGVLAFYKDHFWLGSSYTNNHDLTFMAGFRLVRNLHLGYAFKSSMSAEILKPWSTNSHEIFLNFGFSGNNRFPNSVRNMFSD